ncbi:SDR family oxidoreductase [Parahaliea sp. F7430]|uniref:SDR family oxidoreductase n=1 Tax=Sediminihaliea albiluteola TaxID=2758564 RepID=A0A7W2YJL4_9GAMM|nr:SDR family oxidoreductase [Sediminihaliea albiluteola]MBA6413706.1 SDR family oxidoreductase [Sediminihaliea albiluteola]
MSRSEDPFRFDNKVVVVTGGNGAIGQGLVHGFSLRGAQVVIADHSEAVVPVRSAGAGRVLDVRTDITDRDSVDAMVAQTLDEFGQIDVLVNNAGAGKGVASILEVDQPSIDWLIDLNIRGTLHCTQAIARHMSDSQSGSIVNIASGAALSGVAGRYDPVYAGCKGFMVSLTKVLAMDLGQFGVRVNTVAPGWIVPESSAEISDGSFWVKLADTFGTPEQFNQDFERDGSLHASSDRALARLGRPSDIANATIYFASDAACHVTGQLLSVCGGAIMPS